jgi:hypothetical protein
MENYEQMTEAGDSWRRSRTEDEFTRTVEEYTSAIPSSAYLGVAFGAMALSLLFQLLAKENGAIHRAMGAYVANHRPVQQIG